MERSHTNVPAGPGGRTGAFPPPFPGLAGDGEGGVRYAVLPPHTCRWRGGSDCGKLCVPPFVVWLGGEQMRLLTPVTVVTGRASEEVS